MNGWDVFTWVSAVGLAASAVLIFAFFLRDARSIFNRDMHGHDDDAADSSASGATPGKSPPTSPEDLPR
jgi:hypothetical protein